MRLRFTARAAHDLTNIAEFIGKDNPRAAQRVRASIVDTLEVLRRFPRLGRPQSVEGVRKLITRRYYYSIYYILDDPADQIVILTIRHRAQAPLG